MSEPHTYLVTPSTASQYPNNIADINSRIGQIGFDEKSFQVNLQRKETIFAPNTNQYIIRRKGDLRESSFRGIEVHDQEVAELVNRDDNSYSIDFEDLKKIANIVAKIGTRPATVDQGGQAKLKVFHVESPQTISVASPNYEANVSSSALGIVIIFLFSGLMVLGFLYKAPLIHPLLGIMLVTGGIGFYFMGKLSNK